MSALQCLANFDALLVLSNNDITFVTLNILKTVQDSIAPMFYCNCSFVGLFGCYQNDKDSDIDYFLGATFFSIILNNDHTLVAMENCVYMLKTRTTNER